MHNTHEYIFRRIADAALASILFIGVYHTVPHCVRAFTDLHKLHRPVKQIVHQTKAAPICSAKHVSSERDSPQRRVERKSNKPIHSNSNDPANAVPQTIGMTTEPLGYCLPIQQPTGQQTTGRHRPQQIALNCRERECAIRIDSSYTLGQKPKNSGAIRVRPIPEECGNVELEFSEVESDSLAAQLGFRNGDRIIRLNDAPIHNVQPLLSVLDAIEQQRAASVHFTYQRGEDIIPVHLTLSGKSPQLH